MRPASTDDTNVVIKVWQFAAALLLLIASPPAAFYLVGHGHTKWVVIASLLPCLLAFPLLFLARRRRVRRKGDTDDSTPSAEEASAPEAEPVAAPGRTTGFWLAAVCAGGMALGAIAPWEHSPIGATAGGLDGRGDGWVLLGAAAIAGLTLWLHHRSARRRWLILTLLAGVAGAGLTAYDRQLDIVRVGWGLHLGLVSSVGLVVFALSLLAGTVTWRKAPSVPVETWPEPISQPSAVVDDPAPSASAAIERPVASGGVAADLERLAALHASGALEDEEFRAAKALLLQGSPVAARREALLRTRGPYYG